MPETFEKAVLEVGEKKITCAFNPQTYTITKSNNWHWSPVKGAGIPPVEFGGGAPAVLSVRILLDVSLEPKETNVAEKLDSLLGAANIPADKGAGKAGSVPPTVTFRWGQRSFKGVITDIQAQLSVFRLNGNPVRAWVDLTLMESEQTTQKAQNPTTQARPDIEVRTLRAGDTLQQIAYETLGDPTKWRRIAEFNDIDNPFELPRGREIAIPTHQDQ